MTRNEYMEQLKKYLKRLPKEDYDNAIEYFSEYFDEAGPENEQQVMEELGQPREAARELLLNLLQESVGGGKDSTGEKTAALPEVGSVVQGRSTAGRMPMIPQKISVPREDHPPCYPGPLCVTSQSGTSDQCADSTVCSSCCDRISDLFPGCDKCCSDSRRNPACRFWCDADTEVRGSSVYDGRQRISYGRRRDPDRNSYHIYL